MAKESSGLILKPMGQLVQALGQYYTPPSDQIRGLDPNTWYSPLQPIKPYGPPGTEPRGFQYWAGQNLIFTPRPDAEYSAAQLKSLAIYPLARICIENVKDTLTRASWQIQRRPQPGETRRQAQTKGKGDPIILKLSRFFERPDREHMWDEWLRPLADDMLVIDAATILIRKSFKGEIAEMPVLRGESITRYIDANGFTPLPPDPAYAQNWWGIPLVNLTTDQLIYKPRNIVPRNTISSQLYGMSPTEQLSTELEVGIERLRFVLAYYTEGSVPGVMQVVPKGTNPDKIAEAMAWMNSELAGNLGARRQIRLIQGWAEPGKSDQVIMTKEPLLADAFDDMHIKKVAFGYGVSPQRLSRQLNRATAQQQDEAAQLEGALPYFNWLKSSVMDFIIQQHFGFIDYEWIPDPFEDPSFEKAAKAVNAMMNKPVMTINEARDRIGLELRAEPEADELGMTTSTGWMPLSIAIEQAKAFAGLTPEGAAPGPGSQPPAKKKDPKEDTPPDPHTPPNTAKKINAIARVQRHDTSIVPVKNAKNFGFGAILDLPSMLAAVEPDIDFLDDLPVAKASAHDTRRAVIHPGRSLPASVLGRHRLEKLLLDEFKSMRKKTSRILMKRALKAVDPRLKKISDEEKAAEELKKALHDNWLRIGDTAKQDLEDAALAGANAGVVQLDINDEGMINELNTQASTWAAARSAELVGMRRLKDGSLIPNARAEMAISETTREKLKEIIADVFRLPHPDLTQVEKLIQDSGIYDDVRASVIARTEIAAAQTQGNLTTWRESKLVKQVSWQLSMNHDKEDACDELAAGSPYNVDEVPFFPAHPNCLCTLVLHTLVGEEPS